MPSQLSHCLVTGSKSLSGTSGHSSKAAYILPLFALEDKCLCHDANVKCTPGEAF